MAELDNQTNEVLRIEQRMALVMLELTSGRFWIFRNPGDALLAKRVKELELTFAESNHRKRQLERRAQR